MRKVSDVVVVGSGIAGTTMAYILSRAGLKVVLLERQPILRDRARGEFMFPWGVAEARRLGVLGILVRSGAHWIPRQLGYDENLTHEQAEAMEFPLGAVLPEIPGALSFFQPSACGALARAAVAAGAEVRSGVRSITVTLGRHPQVAYEWEGVSTVVRCRLVIGADGRTSTVRAQAGIRLERLPANHVCSAMLVDGATGFPDDIFVVGVEGDVTFVICPQGSGRVRLYLLHARSSRGRFAGPGGTTEFLRSYRLRSVPRSESLAGAAVAGPCATLDCDDSWTSQPSADGVVLIGDAAGFNDPVIGQGLSLAMRDVRVLSDLILTDRDWSQRALQPYAEERGERMRRVRIVATAMAKMTAEYSREARQRRLRFGDLMRSNGTLEAAVMAVDRGPETAPAEAFVPGFIAELIG